MVWFGRSLNSGQLIGDMVMMYIYISGSKHGLIDENNKRGLVVNLFP